MAGLAASKMTLNFSRSSAGNFEQLKTRVIEATLAGTFLLTDDRDRTRLYFEPEVEYGFFGSVAELPVVVDRWLSDDAQRIAGARAAQVKAENIAVTDFWERIDQGLVARGLPVTGAG
jgi:spore maturation protein CgeB